MTQITFLMGIDDDPTNGFYALAAKFFAQPDRPDNRTITPTKAQGQLALEDVFATLATVTPVPSVINIVCHAMGFGFMSFPLTRTRRDTDHSDSTGLDELMENSAPVLKVAGITGQAQVVIYGCDIGRSRQFVARLAQLFGSPLQIFAPRRVAYFYNPAGVVMYRLAQTWTVPASQLGYIPSLDSDPEWPAFHARFVTQAVHFFGPMATMAGGPGGPATLQALITGLANNKTLTPNPSSFFFIESVTAGLGEVTATQPLVNGDPPPKMNPPSVAEVDDNWVVTRLTDADGVTDSKDPGSQIYTVVVLASIIPTAVDFTDASSFLSMYTAPQIAPQVPGPAGSPTGSGSSPTTPPGPSGDLGSLTDQLVAAGVAQADLDPLLAALVPPAADGDDALISADPEVPPADDPDDANIDQLLPLEDV